MKEIMYDARNDRVLTLEEYRRLVIRELKEQGIDTDIEDIDRSMSEDTDYTLAYECDRCGEIIVPDQEHDC